jgi:hypothetical protein
MRVRQHARSIGRALREGTSPLRWVAQDAARPEPGRRLPPSISIEKEELARDCRGGVVLQNLRLAALIAGPLGFECHSDPETRIEVGTVLEVDGHFGTIAAFFKKGDRPDDFPGEVFAFNHRMSSRRNEATLAHNNPNWNELRRELTLYSAIFIVVFGFRMPRVISRLEDARGR